MKKDTGGSCTASGSGRFSVDCAAVSGGSKPEDGDFIQYSDNYGEKGNTNTGAHVNTETTAVINTNTRAFRPGNSGSGACLRYPGNISRSVF